MEATTTVLVTGASGFMGKNLVVALRRQPGLRILEFDVESSPETLAKWVAESDLVFHLAGVNRPREESELLQGNVTFTQHLLQLLGATSRAPLVFSSSIQAELENTYGRSKRAAEEAVLEYHRLTGVPVRIYRFPNVFGKWSRPHYNTVVATFCHQISRGLSVQVSDPSRVIRFVYIDDIVREFARLTETMLGLGADPFAEVTETHEITLGELHRILQSFHSGRAQRRVPDLSRPLVKYLYSTYLSFCDPHKLATPVDLKSDDRGWLFELVKTAGAGQIFVSTTRPGVTRGNHYHDTKVEKFCVIQGQAMIRLRSILGGDLVEYPVNDRDIRVVDIPPGYTHSIENTGSVNLVTLFWANEVFDVNRPDTYTEPVLPLTQLGAS
jgi:UDP-2-acetamido-2,6-beta-L-arabino-hexul-4-ose reductase